MSSVKKYFQNVRQLSTKTEVYKTKRQKCKFDISHFSAIFIPYLYTDEE